MLSDTASSVLVEINAEAGRPGSQICEQKWRQMADTVEKLAQRARFALLEDERSRGSRVIGYSITANYG